ncbi:MAG TPA: LuxR C-terminal-related transcriptional regulator, partial [Candidatus Limnocylindrales bacterium]
VALGRGRLDTATDALDEARQLGTRMRELQRLSPALWGLAEVALARDDPATAIDLAEEGRAASAIVADAAYLFPWVVTGTRALIAAGDPAAARAWLASVETPIRRRSIPGTLPAIEHAAGLVALAEGGTGRARAALSAAVDGWAARRRTWEGTWALVDLARAHARAHRPAEATRLAAEVGVRASRLGAPGIGAAATAVARAAQRGREPDPWSPLTAREWEVAGMIAVGATNVEIADALGISRRTVAAHVEHILAKLGVGRRTEIAAWASTRDTVGPVLHSRPHGDDREE